MKRENILLALAALISALPSFAEITTLPVKQPLKSYAAYCADAFDMNLSLPKGFADEGKFAFFNPNSPDKSTAVSQVSGAMARSTDGNCLVLFSYIPMQNEATCANADICWTTKGNLCNDGSQPDDAACIPVLLPAAKFNADTATAISLPANDEVYGDKHYTARTRIILHKKGRRAFTVNVLFTDQGTGNKQQYIDAICSAIKFGDKQGWTYSAKAEKAARAKHLAEFSKYAKAHSTVTGLAKAK